MTACSEYTELTAVHRDPQILLTDIESDSQCFQHW